MKFTTAALGAALSASVLAYPGMKASMAEIQHGLRGQAVTRRALPGNLAQLEKRDGSVQQEIADCLNGVAQDNCLDNTPKVNQIYSSGVTLLTYDADIHGSRSSW
jgi:hypothetical protein